jgi:hypothetical protein
MGGQVVSAIATVNRQARSLRRHPLLRLGEPSGGSDDCLAACVKVGLTKPKGVMGDGGSGWVHRVRTAWDGDGASLSGDRGRGTGGGVRH